MAGYNIILMKFIIVSVVISFMYFQCIAPKQSAAKNSIPFKDVELKLLQGKVDDSIFNFISMAEQSFIVKFNEKRFRSFDGSFSIAGTSRDTSSVYYTSIPYTGFYNIEGSDNINLGWFSNISWNMGFNKNEMGKIIARLFLMQCKYDYNGKTLIFYKDSGIKKDTITTMKILN